MSSNLPPRMRSAVLVEPGRVELREIPVPTPGPGELVLRIEAALTCGTDIKTFRRGHPKIPLPAPFGHEFAGTVVAAGRGAAFREGDPVAAVPTAPCGECRLCRRGRDNLCPAAAGAIALGAFADYLRLPAHIVASNAFPRTASVPAETCAALEPLACVVHGTARLNFDGEPTVLILGDGAIALLFVQMARLLGAASVAVAGRHASRLDTARALGADRTFCARRPPPDTIPPSAAPSAVRSVTSAENGDTRRAEATVDPRVVRHERRGGPVTRDLRLDDSVDPKSDSLEASVRSWTDGVGADIVIECTGSIDAWQAAPALAARGGGVLLFGGCPAGTRANFDTYRLHYDEVDLIGAFHYGRADVRTAWRLITEGAVRIAPLVTHRRTLARLDEALDLVLSRAAIKVAVLP